MAHEFEWRGGRHKVRTDNTVQSLSLDTVVPEQENTEATPRAPSLELGWSGASVKVDQIVSSDDADTLPNGRVKQRR